MNELQAFKDFFTAHGIRYFESKPSNDPEIPKESTMILVASQALFHFDIDGNYLGVEGDDMGVFRRKNLNS